MLEIIRASLKKLVSNSTTFLSHQSVGRVGEGLTGKLFQHYGFRSIPPKDTDLVTLQDGNNNYSIAENLHNSAFGELFERDVLVYTASDATGPTVYLHPGDDGSLLTIYIGDKQAITLDTQENKLTIETEGCFITLDNSAGTVTIDDGSALAQKLVTKTYSDTLNAWFTANATALASAGCTAWVAPLTGGTTETLEAS
jgi:hypothetical protein